MQYKDTTIYTSVYDSVESISAVLGIRYKVSLRLLLLNLFKKIKADSAKRKRVKSENLNTPQRFDDQVGF